VLATAELTGSTDGWDNYVELAGASRIVCNYALPSGTTASAVTSLALQVNYRGRRQASQIWTFEVLDRTTNTWTLLGDNSFSAQGWDAWAKHTFTLPAPLSRFFSGTNLQIRYGTTSSLDASDLDQLLITGTR
jgi:hypothetical protein